MTTTITCPHCAREFHREPAPVGRPRLPVDAEEIVAMFQAGISIRSIARCFGVSREVVGLRLADAGLVPHPRKGR